MACCPCVSPASCTCILDCPQCGSCLTTFDWEVILSGFTGSADCTALNRTWRVCQTSTACQFKTTIGNDVVQIDYIGGSNTWQFKVSADGGINFAYFTLSGLTFGCAIQNVLTFDHADAGFTCGGIPASVTLTPKAICCQANLPNHCCCLQYPSLPFATLKNVSGCACLDGLTVPLAQISPGCDNPDILGGSASAPGCGDAPALCVAIRIICNSESGGACGMRLLNFTVCTSCTFDGFCSGAPSTCDQSGATDIACGGASPCPAASCSCFPFLLTFNNVTITTTGNCGDSCAGVYNIIVTD